MFSDKAPRSCRVPRFSSFQDCKVADFESSKVPEIYFTRVLGFQVSRVQGSKHQGSRLVRVLVWLINNEMTSAMQSKRKAQYSCCSLFKEHGMGSMIHSKTSTLQLHKVKGSKFFTGLAVCRQESKARRLQEAKFGVPQFHDSRVSYFQHSKFPGSKIHGPRDPYCEKSQNLKFQVKLEGSQCRLQTCKESKVPGSRARGLKVQARFQQG